MAKSTDSALKRARLALNMTLEEAAGALNAITGGATDASLMSAWESGRRRTGKRNRAGLCQVYRERPEVLFAYQDGAATSVLETSGTAVAVKVLTRWTDLVEAMVDVVAGAREQLVVTGSRSREKEYLAAIETAVAQWPDLVHHRVLHGPPRHHALADHLLRLLELRDPSACRNGIKTLHIGMVEPTEALERFFVASETAAVVPLPSFHGAEGFDCGVLLGREAAVGLVHHGREACASARPVDVPSTPPPAWSSGAPGTNETTSRSRPSPTAKEPASPLCVLPSSGTAFRCAPSGPIRGALGGSDLSLSRGGNMGLLPATRAEAGRR
ncbi:helix-turn-helix transcriptional regulator [Streptomyces sp. DvalAA-19]|uniref:helix-turn-helix domain-containing protein n=1 Tax=Streptomyces sp. DvalAA-19 TaxID=1839761 RepID=UPI001EFA2DD2|nr:helix-turn-helix transcriptional regulator [Streptomyces sp. DvalAA-19]